MHKKYDIVYSLGSNCACSNYMKKVKLRTFSGPFDWIQNPDITQPLKLISSDFQHFLSMDDFVSLPEGNEEHDYYKNTRTGMTFLHDFPKGLPLSQSFNPVNEKYNKRIKRFYKLIQQSEKVLFIWVSMYNVTPPLKQKTDIIRLVNKICTNQNKQFDFLIIENDSTLSEPVHTQLTENIALWEGPFRIDDSNGEPELMGRKDLIIPILKQYRLNLPTHIIIKNHIAKIFVQILCAFVPNKNKCHKIKSFFKRHLKYI